MNKKAFLSIASILGLVIIFLIVFVAVSGNPQEEKNKICASINNDLRYNNHLLNWEENGLCCTHKLINNTITKVCI